MEKYLKIIVVVIGTLIMIVVASVIYEEHTKSYGMGKNIFTARPFDVYVYLARWQIKSGRAFELLESIKSKGNIKDNIRLFTFLPIITVNYYSVGDGIRSSSNGADIFLNKNIIDNMSSDALSGVMAHELGHFAKGHFNPTQLQMSPMEMQNQADEWAVGVVGKDFVIAYHKEMHRIGRRVSNLTAPR